MDNQIASNAKTSDYYRTQNLPPRFDNPEDDMANRQKCYFPGNPVVSCIVPPASILMHERKDESDEWFKGYPEKQVNPLYRTTASDYGAKRPTVHTMPTVYYTKSAAFTETLGKTGMYRNQGFNTALPGSKHV